MEPEKKTFFEWVKEHKKCVIPAAAFSAAAIGVAVFLITKNKSMASKVAETIVDAAKYQPIKLAEKPIKSTFMVAKDVYIEPHIMNLPFWKHPSMLKLASALENGFDPKELLEKNQTWVKGYWKKVWVIAKDAIRELQVAA